MGVSNRVDKCFCAESRMNIQKGTYLPKAEFKGIQRIQHIKGIFKWNWEYDSNVFYVLLS